MTVPSLMQNYQRQSYVTQLHKVYNEFSQAFLQYQTEKNALNLAESGFTIGQDMMPFMKQYFKVIQDCDNTPYPCFAQTYRNMNGGDYTFSTRHTNCGTIASGASFCIILDGLDTGTVMTDDFYIQICVDVNGQKGPNIYGRDLFIMYVFPDGVIDEYRINPECRTNGNCAGDSPEDARNSLYAGCSGAAGGNSNYSEGCFGKILNDSWQMKY